MAYFSSLTSTCLGWPVRFLFVLLLLLAATPTVQAQTGGVGIGTTAPDPSAALDVRSTSKGLLPPRLSQPQRDAIAGPAAGLTIFNTSTNKLNSWNGSSWDEVLSATQQPVQNPAVTFNFTGTQQTYTVPAGVTSLRVDASGARGLSGGRGGRVQTTLTVTPGEVLRLYVGGSGTQPPNGTGAYGAGGGYNGGGNAQFGSPGGGGTDIRRGGAAITDRIVVAGGGGGGNLAGGDGGLTGADGYSNGLDPGAGGTASAGGAGGVVDSRYGQSGSPGDAGTLGQGGFGRWGGGGGGYYGGGGGGSINGGGGGGSSFVVATGSRSTTHTPGYRSGNGILTLTPDLLYAAPAISGANIVDLPGTWQDNGTDVYRSTGSVGVGTGASIAASAQLEVSSTSKGFLPPRLSQPQRDAIASPAAGLTVFNTTNGRLSVWNGTRWDEPLSTSEQPGTSAPLTFGYTGGVQTYTVPADLTSLTVEAYGAQGGSGSDGSGGGLGARAQATLAVTPGQTLYLYVGGAGTTATSNSGGFNGGGNNGTQFGRRGGGGGGASDVRTSASGPAYTNRLLTAAGGGGGGDGGAGGAGGNGGAPNGAGGSGPGGGAGGTQTSGNALGQGGNNFPNEYSGGGGGGYWGGRFGAVNGGSGGGGSSWVTPTGSSALSLSAGVQTGNGSITLTPGLSTAAPSFSAANLTNLPAANLTGSVPAASLTSVPAASLTGLVPAASLPALTSTASGTSRTISLGAGNSTTIGVGDDLGSHIATQQLDLAANLLVGNGGSAGLAISSGGSVGIGTASPATTLDVRTADNSAAITVGNTGSTAGAVYLGNSAHGLKRNYATGNDVGLYTTDGTLYLSASGTSTGQFALLNGGNVGIGTNTPGQKLDVAGNASVSGNTTTGGTATVMGNHYVNGTLGVVLNGQDRPLITRGYDAFTSGAYNGIGRWGLFMEPSALTFGVPAIAGRNFQWVKYNGNSSINATMMTLTQDGNLGIGISPASGLHIDRPEAASSTALGVLLSGGSSGNPSIELRGSGKSPYIDFVENTNLDYSTRLLSLGGTLNLNYGGAAGSKPAYIFNVGGGIQATAVNNTSDQRLKQHIRPLAGALASVLTLRGVRYEWNTLGVQRGGTAGAGQIGVLAQEVEKIFPELVSTGADGYKAVNYAQLTPVLIEALKEQQQQIELLKQAVATAKADASSAKAQAATAAADHADLQTLKAQLARLLGEQPTATAAPARR